MLIKKIGVLWVEWLVVDLDKVSDKVDWSGLSIGCGCTVGLDWSRVEGLIGGGSSLLWHLDQHTPIWWSLSCHLNHSHLPTPTALIKFNKTIWKQPHSWAPTALICVNLIRHNASFSSLTVGFAAYKIAENHNGKYCRATERSPIVACNKKCLTAVFQSKTMIWFNSCPSIPCENQNGISNLVFIQPGSDHQTYPWKVGP